MTESVPTPSSHSSSPLRAALIDSRASWRRRTLARLLVTALSAASLAVLYASGPAAAESGGAPAREVNTRGLGINLAGVDNVSRFRGDLSRLHGHAGTAQTQATSKGSAGSGLDGARYAAFGDSYSAGEGTLAYSPDTAVPGTNTCHRSTLAYGPLLDTRQQLGTMAFVACSGSVTADLFGPNAAGNRTPSGEVEPAQLCRPKAIAGVAACGDARSPALGPDTSAVTLTIGGNDVGFANIVRSCVFATIGTHRLGWPGRGCSIDPAVVLPATRRLAALNGAGTQVQSPTGTTIHSLASVLNAIHAAAPNAHVYIAGYPRLFQDTDGGDCVIGTANHNTPIKVAASDAKWLDTAAAALNSSIALAAAREGSWATYVDSAALFAGHGLCTSDSWINPIRATVSIDLNGRTIKAQVDSGSVHPTVVGQDRGFRQAFVTAGLTG